MKKNIIANFFGRFWSTLSIFLFIPIYIHYLGFESYSIISFTLVIAGLMSILDSGLTATLSREIARIDNTRKEKLIVFQTLESSYVIIFAFVVSSIIILSNYISHQWLNLKNYDPNKVALFLKIISLDIGFQMIFRFYMGGLIGLEKQVSANIIQIGWGFCRNGLVIVLIIFLPDLLIFFLWQSFCTIVFVVIIRRSLINGFKDHNFSFPKIKFEKVVFNGIWRFAGGMFLISIVAAFNTQIDKLVISKILPIEDLGYYTIAVSISTALITVASPFSIALLPRFTALYSGNKKEEALALFTNFNKVISILIFSLMSSMIFFSKEIIWAWTGDMKLALSSYTFLPIIAVSYTMVALTIIPFNIAIANGYTRLNNILGISSLIITIPGYWIATRYYGAIGTACVFCIVQIVNTTIYLYIIQKKFLNRISLFVLYGKRILFPIVISLIVGYALSFYHQLYINRVFTLFYIGFTSVLTFLIVILLTSFNDIKNMNFLKTFKSNI